MCVTLDGFSLQPQLGQEVPMKLEHRIKLSAVACRHTVLHLHDLKTQLCVYFRTDPVCRIISLLFTVNRMADTEYQLILFGWGWGRDGQTTRRLTAAEIQTGSAA